jgi:uncharacterized protein
VFLLAKLSLMIGMKLENMRLFLDSSALVKRFIREAGTDQVLARYHTATEIMVSVLSVPEVLSALNRLKKEGRLLPEQYTELKVTLAQDTAKSTLMDLTQEVLKKTIFCLENASVRTLDAIHIASAIISGCDLFISADHRQIEAAKWFHLDTEIIKP